MAAKDFFVPHISCRAPLVGRLVRSYAVKNLCRAVSRGDRAAIGTLSRALVESRHDDVKSVARAALCALSNQPAVDAFCDCVLESADQELLDIAGERSYSPVADEKKALVFFLAGQTDRYRDLDPLEGHPLLARATGSASPKVRSRVLALAEERGMAGLFSSPCMQQDGASWSSGDWRAWTRLLEREDRLDELARLPFLASLPVAVEIVHALQGAGWRPEEEDRALWKDLFSLVPDSWEYPDPPAGRGKDLMGPGNMAEHIAFSPDGKFLAAAGHDGTLCQWSLPDGTLAGCVMPEGGSISALAFSPDGASLLLGTTGGTIRVVQPGTGLPAGSVPGHCGQVVSLVFSPAGDLLVSAGSDGVIRSSRWPGCSEPSSLHACAKVVTALAASSDMVAGSSGDGATVLCQIGGEPRLLFPGAGSTMRHLFFHGGSSHLVGVDSRGTVRVWDCRDASLSHTVPSACSRLAAWTATPGGDFVALATGDHEAVVYSLPGGTECMRVEVPGGGISCLALHPRGTHLFAGCRDGYLHAWTLPDGQKRLMARDHDDWILLLAVNGAGTGVVSAGREGTLRLRALPGFGLLSTMHGPGTAIECLAGTPGGEILACATAGGMLRAWDTGSGQPVRTTNLYSGRTGSLALDPTGTMAASGDQDGRISLWDLGTGSLRATLEGHKGGIWALAISNDGSLLASGGWDGVVRVWSLPGGGDVAELRGHGSPVTSLGFIPGRPFLASGSQDCTAIVWDLESRSIHARLSGHSHVVSCLGLSGDGRFLATGSWDRTVRLWGIPGGKAWATLRGHTGRVRSLAVHPDGSIIASATESGTVSFWAIPDNTLIRSRDLRADARNGLCLIPGKNLLATAGLDGTLRVTGVPWTRPLCRTTPEDLPYVQSCTGAKLPRLSARHWKFLECLLAGKFRATIGYGGPGLPAGPYDMEIVEWDEAAAGAVPGECRSAL